MNTHKIALGLLIVLLSALCIFQATLSGCSKNTDSDAENGDEVAEAEVPFFERPEDKAVEPAELDWRPFSNAMVDEIELLFDNQDFRIESIDQANDGMHNLIRCILESNPNQSKNKQLLDGLHLLYMTFPNQYRYIIEIDGYTSNRVEAGWGDLEELYDLGYSFETTSADAERFWLEMFGDGNSDWTSGEDVQVSISTE